MSNSGCLEGTTERSDDNRVRSARKRLLREFCLEGSTPEELYIEPVLWRSAFQAHRPHLVSGHFVPGYRRYAPYCLPGS